MYKTKGYNQNLTWESSTKYNAGLDFFHYLAEDYLEM